MYFPSKKRRSPTIRFRRVNLFLYGDTIVSEEIVGNLNPKQKEAVLATEGPVLIIAGPGSGKTKVLTHRVAHIIKNGVPPENILAVTFTNRAADEMRERIRALTYNLQLTAYNPPFIGTFHSLAARILRAHAIKMGY